MAVSFIQLGVVLVFLPFKLTLLSKRTDFPALSKKNEIFIQFGRWMLTYMLPTCRKVITSFNNDAPITKNGLIPCQKVSLLYKSL